jgi:hypothetical protein
MHRSDPSHWPSRLFPIRFTPATGDLARVGELTLTGADGSELGSLVPLLPGEYTVSTDDCRDTMIPVPEGNWEVIVYDGNGAIVDIRVLLRPNVTEDEPIPEVRAWAVLELLWSRSTSMSSSG